jgi:hypothetical protein
LPLLVLLLLVLLLVLLLLLLLLVPAAGRPADRLRKLTNAMNRP